MICFSRPYHFQFFLRLSFRNFTWFIPKYFVPNDHIKFYIIKFDINCMTSCKQCVYENTLDPVSQTHTALTAFKSCSSIKNSANKFIWQKCVHVLTKEVTHFRIKFSNSLLGIRKMNLWIKMANNFQQDTLITVLFLSSLVRMTTFSIIAVQINVNWLHMNSNIPTLSLTHFAPMFLFILIFSSVKEHLYSLKTSENLWFYDLFSGYRCCKIVRRIKMGTKAQYGLMKVKLI